MLPKLFKFRLHVTITLTLYSLAAEEFGHGQVLGSTVNDVVHNPQNALKCTNTKSMIVLSIHKV